jgi:hypothetical protein
MFPLALSKFKFASFVPKIEWQVNEYRRILFVAALSIIMFCISLPHSKELKISNSLWHQLLPLRMKDNLTLCRSKKQAHNYSFSSFPTLFIFTAPTPVKKGASLDARFYTLGSHFIGAG